LPASVNVFCCSDRGFTKGVWSSIIASTAGIGASASGGTVEQAAASFVLEGFGVPSPAMVKGLLDATRIGWRCGVDGNKVKKEGFRFPRKEI